MNAQSQIETPLAKLRQPFADHHISKLPKPTKAQTDAVRADFKKGIRCQVCGSWHHPDVIHLDYVGHAALTDRLLDADMEWSWEPVGFTAEGLPAFDKNGGLWIKLTVAGVSRFGYGSADGKAGGDAVKEIIGDALRNAAMRFGAALDLWHKGDLHPEDAGERIDPVTGEITTGETPPAKREKLVGPYPSRTALQGAVKALSATLENIGDTDELNALMETKDFIELEKQAVRDIPSWWETGDGLPPEFVPMVVRIERKKRECEQADNARTPFDAG